MKIRSAEVGRDQHRGYDIHLDFLRLHRETDPDDWASSMGVISGVLAEDGTCRSSTRGQGSVHAAMWQAYLRLVGDEQLSFDGRAHFFAAAAEAMRRILIDRARKRHAQKRGGKLIQMELHPDGVSSNGQPAVDDLMALDDSLSRLESLDKTKAELVKLRFFAGLSMPEIAAMLDISLATTERRWRFCRAWLKRDMER